MATPVIDTVNTIFDGKTHTVRYQNFGTTEDGYIWRDGKKNDKIKLTSSTIVQQRILMRNSMG